MPVASVPLSPISRLSTAGAPTIVFGVSRGGVLGHVSVQVKLDKEPRAVIGGLCSVSTAAGVRGGGYSCRKLASGSCGGLSQWASAHDSSVL